MITQNDEYQKMIKQRLDENTKSFNILFELKNYCNCISIMCQELDQYIRLLYLVKQPAAIRDVFINNSINDKKWYSIGDDNKKAYITDKDINEFAKILTGWEAEVFEFRKVFKNLSLNINYMLRDPIKGLDDFERSVIYEYVKKYHDPEFSYKYTIKELIPELPLIFGKISDSIHEYFIV